MYQYILDYMGQGRLVFTPILHQKMFWQISVWYFPSMELMPREDKLVWTVSYILFHPPNNPLARIGAAYLGGVVGANVALSVVGQCVVGSGLHWVLCSVGQCIVCSGSGPVYSGQCIVGSVVVSGVLSPKGSSCFAWRVSGSRSLLLVYLLHNFKVFWVFDILPPVDEVHYRLVNCRNILLTTRSRKKAVKVRVTQDFCTEQGP